MCPQVARYNGTGSVNACMVSDHGSIVEILVATLFFGSDSILSK